MKILITGISGFIGHHVMDHILEFSNHDILGIASWKHKGTPQRVAESEQYLKNKNRVSIFTHDLQSPFTKLSINDIGKIDVVINIASESHVYRSIQEPASFIRNNVDISLNLLDLAFYCEPSMFIQFSTDEVYGPAEGTYRSKEWDPHIPSNPYAASKACEENISISYWRTYNMPIVIVNTMNVIGERQDPEKYFPSIIRNILSGETVNIHGKKGETEKLSRFYIHPRNVADALLYIVNNLQPALYPEHKRPDRFNVVGAKELSNFQLATKVANVIGKEWNYKLTMPESIRPGHDQRYSLDGDKLQEFGWNPKYDFDEAIENAVKWYVDNPRWLEM